MSPGRRQQAAEHLRALAGFSMLPLASMLVTPLLLAPILARAATPSEWIAFGVGQSIGIIGAILTQWGWPTAGPARFALATNDWQRGQLFVESTVQRGLVFIVAMPLVATLAFLLSPSSSSLFAAAVAVAATSAGLSQAWFSVASRRPTQMFLYTNLPVAVAATFGALTIALWGAIWVYPCVLLVANLTGVVLFVWRFRGTLKNGVNLRSVVRDTLKQADVAASALVVSMYAQLPVPAASILLPTTDAARFVSADRIYRLSSFATVAVANALHGWTVGHSSLRSPRKLFAIVAHIFLGAVGGALIAYLGPLATRLLFGPQLEATLDVTVWYGLAFFAVSSATPLNRFMLVPAGATRSSLVAALLAACVAVVALFTVGQSGGAAGVAMSLALSESTFLLAVLTSLLLHAYRGRSVRGQRKQSRQAT